MVITSKEDLNQDNWLETPNPSMSSKDIIFIIWYKEIIKQ